MKRYLSIVLSLVVCCLTVQAAAYTPQSVPNPRNVDAGAFVSNPDGLLSSAETAAIQRVAEQLNHATGVELVTVALGDIGNADAFEFSLALFNKWGIGSSGKNTGVLIFFALRSRDIRIVTGGGVEGLLPDAVCSRILEEDIIPVLKKGHYGEGLLAGNKAIARRLTNQQAKEELLLGYKRKPVSESPWNILSICAIVLALIALFMDWIEQPCPNCGKKGSKFEMSRIDVEPTYVKAGKGTRFYTCPHCGHKWRQTYSIPKKERVVYSSGGGYKGGGGFSGGGSFGGGVSFGGGAGGKF